MGDERKCQMALEFIRYGYGGRRISCDCEIVANANRCINSFRGMADRTMDAERQPVRSRPAGVPIDVVRVNLALASLASPDAAKGWSG